jgi:hypothetical protein
MIEFRHGRYHGRGIILDKPYHGVVGIVECAVEGCCWRMVLTVEDGHNEPDKMAAAIDKFLRTHACGREPPS